MKALSWFMSAVFWLFLAVFLPGCNMPNNGIPIYIQIDSMAVHTTQSTQGSASNKITDAWVWVNGEQIGVFQLPAKIPVLKSGDLRVQIDAGVKENGISNTHVQYPFYNEVSDSISGAQPMQTYVVNPIITYTNAADFPFMANFEGSNGFSPAGKVVVTTEDAFEGNSCGKITLGASDTSVTVYTTNAFPLSAAGTGPVWVELNYKCDGFFDCGMISYSSNGTATNLFKITFNPKETWNKTYLNFSNDVGQYRGVSYRLYFTTAKLPTDATPVHIWLDNIKVVQQQ